jgi:Uncharacterized conserved protein
MNQHRRTFLKQAGALAAMPMLAPLISALGNSAQGKTKTILLRSGWQTVNIGDIAHTFGIMDLIKKYLPDVNVVLWPNELELGVDQMLLQKYPGLKIVNGGVDVVTGKPKTDELDQAFLTCDFMLHGSGNYHGPSNALPAWHKYTGKPFGIYGVTIDELDAPLKDLFSKASFVFCRETETLKYLRSLELPIPVQEFGLDATFAMELHNDAKANAYLQEAGLRKGEFICVIPRLRYTPYWQMRNQPPNANDSDRYAISLQHKEKDAAKMRAIMKRWITETGFKVLVCPEVTYQVQLGKETLVDPLPDDLKKMVVWRDQYWLTDEAASVYKQSRALVTFEPHSAIIAIMDKIPSIHLKQPTDTRKGQMFRDIGLGEWYFHIDETPASQVADTLMKIHHHYAGALAKIEKAHKVVRHSQRENFRLIKRALQQG